MFWLDELVKNPVHHEGESLTQFTMRCVVAQVYLDAAKLCREMMDKPSDDSEWNGACRQCEGRLQLEAALFLEGKKKA